MLHQKDHKIGGQAVIEGVMMRAPKVMTVAVRRPSGEIVVKAQRLHLLSDRFPSLKLPFVRGTVSLFGTVVLGIKALNFSAQQALDEDEGEIGPWAMAGTMAGALGLAIVLFILLPLWMTRLLQGHVDWIEGRWGFNLMDGILRLGVFLLYLASITLIKDVKRIFQYHGAEHKSIYAMEAGDDLTVDNARKYSPMHPRCGTSFLLIVMVLSILVFAQIPHAWPFWGKGFARIGLLPIIAGLSYELLRVGDRYRNRAAFRVFLLPGLMLQRLTTREPTDDQLEVALTALKEAIIEEGADG
ncbi:MAG: DUF1385 domain-containing protein [Deltaproteobacteria bacterium]|nr:DUF1385 domain-containing protein [Deltaproteobacteria bacterium]